MREGKLCRVFVILLYALPVSFFILSYFLMIVSGEDIAQGANTALSIVQDSMGAFNHSARLSDMYAWSVINIFDYSFSFGLDTIFRLVDVLAVVGIFYMVIFIALGRKLKLVMEDALLFCGAFLMVILTPYGRVLYAGFSIIHNYVFMILVALLFMKTYLAPKTKTEKCSKISAVGMLIFGIIFGTSSNLIPIAFLGTLAVYCIMAAWRKKMRMVDFVKKIQLWRFLGVFGILIGLVITYGLGPGVGKYANGSYAVEYDYVSIANLLEAPIASMRRVLGHEIYNFGRVLAPIIILFGGAVVMMKIFMKKRIVRERYSSREMFLIKTMSIFTIVYLLCNSQIASPIRLLVPAYFGVLVVVLVLIKHQIDMYEKLKHNNVLVVLIGCMALMVVGCRVYLALDYRERVMPILSEIKDTKNEKICLRREQVRAKNLPLVYLGQEDLLTDWALPQTIYGKMVVFCD